MVVKTMIKTQAGKKSSNCAAETENHCSSVRPYEMKGGVSLSGKFQTLTREGMCGDWSFEERDAG